MGLIPNEYCDKQESKLKYEYNKVMKLAAQKQKELLIAFEDTKKNACISLKNSLSFNNKLLDKAIEIQNKLKSCLISVSSIEEFNETIQNANSSLNDLKASKRKLSKSISIKCIKIEDLSEIKQIVKRSHVKVEDRAHSTTKEHKKHHKKHHAKPDHKETHLHATLSPIKDYDKGNIGMSPSSLETTAVTTIKSGHSIENILIS